MCGTGLASPLPLPHLPHTGQAFVDAAGKVVSAVVSAAGDLIDFAKTVCQARRSLDQRKHTNTRTRMHATSIRHSHMDSYIEAWIRI